jgi:hypothetical protein
VPGLRPTPRVDRLRRPDVLRFVDQIAGGMLVDLTCLAGQGVLCVVALENDKLDNATAFIANVKRDSAAGGVVLTEPDRILIQLVAIRAGGPVGVERASLSFELDGSVPPQAANPATSAPTTVARDSWELRQRKRRQW